MSEILAPAGDKDAFFAAVNSGADAVYLGLTDFSARKSAVNFSVENLKYYTDYAHMLGVKVYVALNTLVKEDEVERFFECAIGAWNAGADALILQDIFLGKTLKENYPEMILHLSTQAGVCNLYGARLAKRYGFSRVILSRETPLEGIRAIASVIETEVFVQGALCTCFSGQCYLSAFVGGNSGNRGFCKQPCRKKYRINRKGFEGLSYRLSLSDLCVGENIADLCKAGVYSFKIEGRMRSPSYVGAAVRYYRDLLDENKQSLPEDLSDLKRTFNRGDYTKGYLFGQDKNLISFDIQGHKGECIGCIVKRHGGSGKLAFVRSDFKPLAGDGFKVIRENREVGGGAYLSSYPSVKGGFYLPWNEQYREGDKVYVTLDNALAARVLSRTKRVQIQLDIRVEEGKAPFAVVSGTFGRFETAADFLAQSAKTRAVEPKEIEETFSKTDAYPFDVLIKDIRIQGKPFLVRSLLNSFRRQVFDQTARRLIGERSLLSARKIEKKSAAVPAPSFEVAVIDSDFSALKDCADKIGAAIFAPLNYKETEEIQSFLVFSKYYAWHKYLYLPAFMTDADIASVTSYVSGFDGVYAEGVWAIEFCRTHGIALFAGTGFNLFNSLSLSQLVKETVCAVAISKELSKGESASMGGTFRLLGGSVKVMELGHCPFGKHCSSCDKREYYLLTDEQSRAFPLRRYENSCCRFELFNCLPLSVGKEKPALYDLRTLSDAEKISLLTEKRLSRSTAGLGVSGVL